MRYAIQEYPANSFAFEDIARQRTLADRMVIRHLKLIVGQAEKAIEFSPERISAPQRKSKVAS